MTNYNVGSGQTRFRLALYPDDSATVTSGGALVATRDGGAITLDGGVSVGTLVLSAGTEDVEGGSAIGTVIENGGSLFIPRAGSILGTLILSGGNVTMGSYVGGSGTGNGTVINGGTENLFAYSSESNDLIENGGLQYLDEGLVVARNVTIDHGGEQITLGKTFGVIVNSGGQQVSGFGDGSYGLATGTVVNSGGEQILDGGASVGTIINSGGLQDVYSYAQGTIINGGTMIVEEMAETGYAAVTGGIRFIGTNGVLELAGTTLTTTTLSGFALTDRIDLMDFGFTSSARATIAANNVLSIRGLTGGTASLTLDHAANYAADSFKLSSDGHGGTNIVLHAASSRSIPTLASLQATAGAQGDPLGLRAAFTRTAPPAVVSASASAMTLPDATGGSSQALAWLMHATSSSAHLQLLPHHQ